MQDLRLAIRSLRATPIVTFAAVLSLALGIGANTAIFSIVSGLLLRTLPVAEPGQLATISSESAIRLGFTAGLGWSYAMWERLRDRIGPPSPFEGAIVWSIQRFSLTQTGETEPVNGLVTNGEFFTTLGVTAVRGRTFTAADDVRGGGADGPVAVISHGLWQRRFGGAADIVGRRLTIEGVAFTIVGVTPARFLGIEVGRPFDVAVPLGTEPLIRGRRASIDAPESLVLIVMLRLGPGQSLEAATSALRAMQPQILGPSRMPDFVREPFTLVAAAQGTSGTEPGTPGLRQRFARPLVAIAVIVALVLLIACANLANLQLARAAARRHEISVRLAIGAPRWRLARQLLVESLVLATAGGAAGLVFAAWSSRVLVAQLATHDARVALDLSIDWRVMGFTAMVTIVTALIFGTVPAFHAARVDPVGVLKTQGRSASVELRGGVSNGLVVAQVALSLVLVVATALFVRTFARLTHVPLGYDPDRTLTVSVSTAHAGIDPGRRVLFYHQLATAVAAVPGVEAAAASVWGPVNGGGARLGVEAPGGPSLSELERRRMLTNFVTPKWFAAHGTALRAGRDFDDGDNATAAPVAIIGEAIAQRFFPDTNPIGRTVRTGGREAPARTIVGLVSDQVVLGGYTPEGSLRSPRDGATPMVYIPLAQSADLGPPGATDIRLTARSAAGSPALLSPAIAAALGRVNHGLTYSFRPLAEDVRAGMAQARMLAMLSGLFGTLAFVLAALGLYGVTAHAVSRRRTEIGIRMALGAVPADVVRLVLARVALLIAAGVLVGTGVSVWASRFVATLLYGVAPGDLVTLSGAVLALTAAGLTAAWIPAVRAARIDPAAVLRAG
jgi:putative ABC transport system permease protein